MDTGSLYSDWENIVKLPKDESIAIQNVDNSKNASKHLTFGWKDLQVSLITKRLVQYLPCVKKVPKQVLLEPNSGIVIRGELIGVVGPSGAGKTLFLNALRHQAKRPGLEVEGTRFINGVLATPAQIANYSACVLKEDMFLYELTALEHLEYQARLRLSYISEEERAKRIEEVIAEVGLGKCKGTTIGKDANGLSGGERKRLAFAAEVLTNPPILFLDEPTTGQDSASSEQIVRVLRALASQGRIVICSVHQPSSYLYTLFDKFIHIAHTKVSFFGTKADASQFYTNLGHPIPDLYSPSDWYISCLTTAGKASYINSCYTASELFKDNIKAIDDEISQAAASGDSFQDIISDKPRLTVQFRALLGRALVSKLRGNNHFRNDALITLFMAICIGSAFLCQDMSDSSLINTVDMIFIIVSTEIIRIIGYIAEFDNWLAILKRENSMKSIYHPALYYISRMITDLPFSCFLVILNFCMVSNMSGVLGEVNTTSYNSQERYRLMLYQMLLLHFLVRGFSNMICCMGKRARGLGMLMILYNILSSHYIMVNSQIYKTFERYAIYMSWLDMTSTILMTSLWEGRESIGCQKIFHDTFMRHLHHHDIIDKNNCKLGTDVLAYELGSDWRILKNFSQYNLHYIGFMFHAIAMLILSLRSKLRNLKH